MRCIRLLALFGFLAIGPAASQPFTTNAAPATTAVLALPTSTQARTVIVTHLGSTYIYVTAWHIVPASGAVVTWSYGTGTNCGTGTKIIDGPDTYGTTIVPDNYGNGTGAQLIIPQNNDLCLTITTGAIAGSLAYGQF